MPGPGSSARVAAIVAHRGVAATAAYGQRLHGTYGSVGQPGCGRRIAQPRRATGSPTASPPSEPTVPPSEAASAMAPPRDPEWRRHRTPRSRSTAADPTEGQLGTFVWAGGGSDSPWLPGTPIAAASGETLGVTLSPDLAVTRTGRPASPRPPTQTAPGASRSAQASGRGPWPSRHRPPGHGRSR